MKVLNSITYWMINKKKLMYLDRFNLIKSPKSPKSPMFGTNKGEIKSIHTSGNDGKS